MSLIKQHLYNLMNNTDFICAYFGSDWTITARGFASLKDAESHGKFMMPTAGVFGFAVIQETKDWWQVRDDYSMLPPNVSVGTDGINSYKVTHAPKLELV